MVYKWTCLVVHRRGGGGRGGGHESQADLQGRLCAPVWWEVCRWHQPPLCQGNSWVLTAPPKRQECRLHRKLTKECNNRSHSTAGATSSSAAIGLILSGTSFQVSFYDDDMTAFVLISLNNLWFNDKCAFKTSFFFWCFWRPEIKMFIFKWTAS